MFEHRARIVRFWTALIIYAGVGLAAVEILLAVREEFRLPEALDVVVVALFVAGFLATALLLRTGVAAGGSPILQAMRAFAVVLLFAAGALFIAHLLQPEANAGDLAALLEGLAGTR